MLPQFAAGVCQRLSERGATPPLAPASLRFIAVALRFAAVPSIFMRRFSSGAAVSLMHSRHGCLQKMRLRGSAL
jgi:hypothetical protein